MERQPFHITPSMMENREQPGKMKTGLLCTVIVFAWCIIQWPGFERYAMSADITLDLSAGYASNPLEESDGKGSGFSEYAATLVQDLSLGDAWILEAMPWITYQDLWKFKDNYALGADLALSPKTPLGNIIPGFFAGAHLFRDQLVKADERSDFSLGARVDWFVSARYSLSLEAAWKSINYLSESAPLSHGSSGQGNSMPGGGGMCGGGMCRSSMSGNGMGGGTMQTLMQPVPARDERDLAFKAAMDLFLLPNLTGTLALDYGDLSSSLDLESYRQLTPSVSVVWLFMDKWQLALDLAIEYRDYYALEAYLDGSGGAESIHVRERNETRSMLLEVRRSFDKMAVFARYGIVRGEHPLNREFYTRQIIQCGISLSY
ncbi:MAG: hypothetical protein V1793_14990 [Pseudomonadota bacterium]